MAAAKCGFWDALFTLGISCANAASKRGELRKTIAKFENELNTAKSLDEKMVYFDNLKKLSNVLVEESTGLLDLTKEFRQKLEDTKYELEQDFTDEEIDD